MIFGMNFEKETSLINLNTVLRISTCFCIQTDLAGPGYSPPFRCSTVTMLTSGSDRLEPSPPQPIFWKRLVKMLILLKWSRLINPANVNKASNPETHNYYAALYD